MLQPVTDCDCVAMRRGGEGSYSCSYKPLAYRLGLLLTSWPVTDSAIS